MDKSGHIKAGVRQGDSEFCVVLSPFRFGKIYKVLDRSEEFSFGDRSGSIVFADDLEWSVTIVGKIISAMSFPISGRYRQSRREVVRIA